MTPMKKILLAPLLCLLLSCPLSAQQMAQQILDTQEQRVQVTALVTGLYHPWAVAFLPDGRLLITERRGTLRIVEKGKLLLQPVAGLPDIVEHGQGGLLDIALHPKYAENGWIYWTYNAGQYGTELARGKLGGSREAPRMTDVQVLFKMQPKSDKAFHFGSRLIFDKQGYLYMTLGDRGDSPAKGSEHRAQKLDDHAGKTIRLHDDGRVPADNPFVKTAGARPEIYSFGHRNMQGGTLHPDTGKVWTHEHGPQGGDEVNILQAGANYGWPVITYGANYGTGTKIGEGTAKEGMMQPLLYWVPSIAPSGMAFYSGRQFPKWKGNLLVGALAQQHLMRVSLAGEKVTGQEKMFEGKLGRIRDVREGPDGYIYLLTDDPKGSLLRLEPAK
ncbi:MAG: PQQ-dependent sugar dehydrogenase [Betaproteobacteria bacterium]|nr:PQQ-dependent sugar dehydrogenase [Betaproteobacteria bacterium]